jgi:hypothetical protein
MVIHRKHPKVSLKRSSYEAEICLAWLICDLMAGKVS